MMTMLPIVALAALLGRTSAQGTDAVCESTFSWANNHLGQSPCLVASDLTDNYVYALLPNYHYIPPNTSPFYCNTVVYSLFSACADCQGEEWLTWAGWSQNCTAVYVSTYPETIPKGTAIPHWAFLDVTADAFDDSTAAEDAATNHSDVGPPSSGPNKGAIAGGVVGGVVALALILFGLWFWRRKKRQDFQNRDEVVPPEQGKVDPQYTEGNATMSAIGAVGGVGYGQGADYGSGYAPSQGGVGGLASPAMTQASLGNTGIGSGGYPDNRASIVSAQPGWGAASAHTPMGTSVSSYAPLVQQPTGMSGTSWNGGSPPMPQATLGNPGFGSTGYPDSGYPDSKGGSGAPPGYGMPQPQAPAPGPGQYQGFPQV